MNRKYRVSIYSLVPVDFSVIYVLHVLYIYVFIFGTGIKLMTLHLCCWTISLALACIMINYTLACYYYLNSVVYIIMGSLFVLYIPWMFGKCRICRYHSLIQKSFTALNISCFLPLSFKSFSSVNVSNFWTCLLL